MSETHAGNNLKTLHDFVFRQAAEGIVVTDTEGVIILMNPAAAAMLHMTPTDIIGHKAKDTFPKNPNLLRLLRMGKPETAMIPLARDRFAQGIGENLPDGRRIVILNDITEKRELITRREALVKSVSHDLSNPLNALVGYADLVDRFGDLNERQALYLSRIQQTSKKVLESVVSLVYLAWIESGMPMQYVPFDLAGIIRQVASDLSTKARDKKIKLIISTQNSMPTMMGDAKSIQQALTFLVDNAIQYSPAESNVIIHAWQQERKMMCSVADRGFGISEDEQELIWDRLWRSQDSRVAETSGGGIGLTYAKLVIERHGGQIWVESQLNKGTTFTFLLPFVEQD